MSRYQVCALALLPALSFAATPDARDPKADQIANLMVQAMGGQDAWNRAHFVRFDFTVKAGGKEVVHRAHLWDKYTGRYRLEDTSKDGHARVALFNIATKKGDVWVDGKKLGDPAAALKEANGEFINDMYWLAMPWKWMDQGVHLKYKERRVNGDDVVDIVELSFDKVGLTPGDVYQAWVNAKTHLMDHWEYKLQGGNRGGWNWYYLTTGGVKLARDHRSADGKSIDMGNVTVSDTTDDALFTGPARKMP